MLAPPLPEDDVTIEEGTVQFARVTGVRMDARDRELVTLRYDDGGSGEFQADAEIVAKAARLYRKQVEARVTFVGTESGWADGELEDLFERDPSEDLLTTMTNMRRELEDQGIAFDAAAWLAEERGDE